MIGDDMDNIDWEDFEKWLKENCDKSMSHTKLSRIINSSKYKSEETSEVIKVACDLNIIKKLDSISVIVNSTTLKRSSYVIVH